MSIYIRGNNPIKSIFYRGKFISKGYTNANNIVKQIFTDDIVTITINPIDESGNPITGYTITFFNYGVGIINNNSITVKSGTNISYTINKDNYFMKTVTNRTVNQTETITETLSQKYTFTINPTPSDATITLSSNDPDSIIQGNSIIVHYGSYVDYTVSKTHYITQTGTQVITTNTTKAITLALLTYTLTINTTPSDATVTFSTGTVSGKSCTVTDGTSVTYTVSKQYYNSTSATVTVTSNQTINVTITTDYYIPTVNEVIVNLTGSSKYEANTKFIPGRYRVEVAPGKNRWANSDLDVSNSYVSNMNHTETLTEPFQIKAYCGSNATTSSPGTNPYSGAFKVNGQTNSGSAGTDVNHIFGTNGGNSYFGMAWSSQYILGSSGNCLGNGGYSTDPMLGIVQYGGAGSCCHLLPINGTFGTNYLRAYHTCATSTGGGNGSAYGGAGTGPGPNQGFATNWYTRGGNTPYGNGATAESSAGTGIGNGKACVYELADKTSYGAGAYYNGSQWVDEPGNGTNTGSSYIKITYLGQ